MTKAEEKLLELLMEKVEALEAKVEEMKAEPSGNVIHNHFHTHYHPRQGYWNNWPYYGSTWCSSSADSFPKSGALSISSQSGSSVGGGGSYGLNNTTSKLDLGKYESEAEYQVIGLARV